MPQTPYHPQTPVNLSLTHIISHNTMGKKLGLRGRVVHREVSEDTPPAKRVRLVQDDASIASTGSDGDAVNKVSVNLDDSSLLIEALSDDDDTAVNKVSVNLDDSSLRCQTHPACSR
jgi:hypothetical protein